MKQYVLEYDLSILKLLLEDSEGYRLLEGMSLSTVVGTVLWIFLLCFGWSFFNKWKLDN